VAKSPAPTEDRALALDLGHAWVFAVIDGAGGMGGGGRAADVVASTIEALARRADPGDLADAGFWCVVLAECDAAALADARAGEAAAAVLCVTGEGAFGASVGDCRIWARGGGEVVELTASQRRRPMLGDGGATPWPLDTQARARAWALATDGVDVFGRAREVGARWAESGDLGAFARELVELGRGPGGFGDDVAALVVARGDG
jgi:hypothetical protein